VATEAAPVEEPAVVVRDEEATRVYHWRIHRFRELGFTLWQARRLADRQADWHSAQVLLAHDCPLELVFDILS
jgi:hypothetical protein